MANTLLINTRSYQTRVALLEDDKCVEYYTENPACANLAGNIYLGRVRRVLPGMQAAFVDIGLPKAAFLYVGDVCDPWASTDNPLLTRDNNDEMPKIESLLRPGQEVMVQVAKEPLGDKGPRVTNFIALPSWHLVFMPSVSHVGISRRIESEEERERLRLLVSELRPTEAGFIVRTAAEGLSREKLEAEIKFLYSMWQSIRQRWEQASAPCVLYQDLSVSLRSVRDLASQDIDKLVIDCPREHKVVEEFISTFMPSLLPQLELYDQERPMFQAYGVDNVLKDCQKNKIWLRSGGYIIFQRTEALTVVDVNTGRYVGNHNLEETMLNTNLEAVKEIACQLRLRNIGGLIVIDFIDMQQEASREQVVNSLKQVLSKDRSKTNVLDMSALGLVEMTRKRVREPWVIKERQQCPYCDGEGMVKQPVVVCHDIYRALEALNRHGDVDWQHVSLRVHPDISGLLKTDEQVNLAELEAKLKLCVTLQADSQLHCEEFFVTGAQGWHNTEQDGQEYPSAA